MQDNNENTVNENAVVTEPTDVTPAKIKDLNEVISLLTELFPNCFSIKGEAKPLQIGIFKALAERLNDDERVSRTTLRSALRRYTASWRYLEAIKEGASRVDLDGNEVAAIEAEHITHAQEELVKSKEVAAERRKQQLAKKREANKAQQDKKPKAKADNKRPAKSAKPAAVDVKVKKRRNLDVGLYEGKLIKVMLDNAPVVATIKEMKGEEIVIQTFGGVTVTTETKNVIE